MSFSNIEVAIRLCKSEFQTEPPSDESQLNYRGDVIIALKFVPPPTTDSKRSEATRSNRKAKGMLMVLVKEAKNLVPAKGSTTADPFCKW